MSKKTEKLNNSFMVISIVINVIKPLLEIFDRSYVVGIGSIFKAILIVKVADSASKKITFTEVFSLRHCHHLWDFVLLVIGLVWNLFSNNVLFSKMTNTRTCSFDM